MTDVLKLKAGEFFDPEEGKTRKVLTYVFFGYGEKEEYGYPVFSGFLLSPGNRGKKEIIERDLKDPVFKESEDKRVLIYILPEEEYFYYREEAKNRKDTEGDIEDVTDNDIEIANEEPITLYLTLEEYLSLSASLLFKTYTRNASPEDIREDGIEEYPFKSVGDILSPEDRTAFKSFLRG